MLQNLLVTVLGEEIFHFFGGILFIFILLSMLASLASVNTSE